MFRSCTSSASASAARTASPPAMPQTAVAASQAAGQSPQTRDNSTSVDLALSELFAHLSQDAWITAHHDLTLEQPNLASVISAIQWIFPIHTGESLSLGGLQLGAHVDHLSTTPEMCMLDPTQVAALPGKAVPIALKTGAKPNPILSMIGNALGRKPAIATQGEVSGMNESAAPQADLIAHLPRNLGYAPYLHEYSLMLIFEHLARQAGLSKKWPQEALHHLIRNEKGHIDISPVLRDALLSRLGTLLMENPHIHSDEYQFFDFLKTNPATEELLCAIKSLADPEDIDASADNKFHLPLAARMAILHHAPGFVPLLSSIRQMAFLAGNSSNPPVDRFILFEESDKAYLSMVTNNPAGTYAPTFIDGIERLMVEENGLSTWRILQPDGTYKSTDHFSDVLAAVARDAVAHSLAGQPESELPAWHWPLSLHVAASKATSLKVPKRFVLTEAEKMAHIQANREQVAKQRADFRQQELEREQKEAMAQLRRQAEMRENCTPTPETFLMAASAPSPGVVELSDAYSAVFEVPGSQQTSHRQWVLNLLDRQFIRQEVSHLAPSRNNQIPNADHLCWMRAGVASVLVQIRDSRGIYDRLASIQYSEGLRLDLAFLLTHLHTLYSIDPDTCLGKHENGGHQGLRIAPNMTLKDLHGMMRSEWPLSERNASRNIERELAKHHAYLALGFRFESSAYASESASLIPFYNTGAGAEMPIALHRTLGLPVMVVEHNAIGPNQLNIRVALPKEHPLHPEWERMSAALTSADDTKKNHIMHRMLDLFSGLPVLYLESLTKTDSIGHYTLYLPRKTESSPETQTTSASSPALIASTSSGAPSASQVSGVQKPPPKAAKSPTIQTPIQPTTQPTMLPTVQPLNYALQTQHRWTGIETHAKVARFLPDTENVNAGGLAGFRNDYQVRYGTHHYNAHQLALWSESRKTLTPEPFTFAQSPSRQGTGTAGQAMAWLQLAASTDAPIFQFVHPQTLRNGSYRREQSLITLLQDELKRSPDLARWVEVMEIRPPAHLAPTDRTRHFKIQLKWQASNHPGHVSMKTVDLTLCAAELNDGVFESANLQTCSRAFEAATQAHYLQNPDTSPIVLSTGGFGRSSCLGILQSIKRRMRSGHLSLEQTLQLADELIMLGKTVRSPMFVQNYAQYLQLQAAIIACWNEENDSKSSTQPGTPSSTQVSAPSNTPSSAQSRTPSRSTFASPSRVHPTHS